MLITFATTAQGSYGEIIGRIFEKSNTEEPAFGATIWVMNNGAKIAGKADFDGRFRLSAIPAGTYKIEGAYMGEELQDDIIVQVKADGIINLGRIDILEKIQIADGYDVIGIRDPLIDFGDVGIRRISTEDIMNSPVRNSPGDLIVSTNSDIKMTEDGDLIIRGSRAGDMVYFIDGIKMRDVKAIPSVAIGGITVYASAIPAKYGDTTGGVIIMETKSYQELWRARKIMKQKAETNKKKNEEKSIL